MPVRNTYRFGTPNASAQPASPRGRHQRRFYDNALAESVIGLYKTEVIRKDVPWKSIEPLEFATLEWVSWCNTQRLMEPLGYLPPDEYEAQYHIANADFVALALQ